MGGRVANANSPGSCVDLPNCDSVGVDRPETTGDMMFLADEEKREGIQ